MNNNALIDAIPDVSQQVFRNAMANMGAAVTIITTDGPGGKAGFAATAVCSVTDSPATLLVCLNRTASVFDAVMGNKALCVNVLAAGHESLSTLFGGKTPVEERFAAADWHYGVTGAPVLEDAMVSFDCLLTEMTDVGTHRVLFCAVKAIRENPAEKALVYYKRAYHHLGAS
ncbi:flavin reductase [Rhizobium sp. HT1-10]|uniref:flavin reductase n=1 Tax=Rhizobium sp. HT1-10 TaxID=3111638 RepID=UPI003C16AB66